jgi:beta-glucanase (GH16 family)
MFSFTGMLLYGQATKLVWSDEFDGAGLPDSTKWGYDTGTGCPQACGWGNNELQYYTGNRRENARQLNGHLVIEARKESMQTKRYTSARLVSKNKGEWKYGRIEIRAKLAKGKGIWPAIWMMPATSEYGGWPKSGEIDIMEFVGYMPDSVFGSVHTGLYNHKIGTQRTKGIGLTDLSTAFHIYAIDWTAEKISFLIDGRRYFEFQNNKSGPGAWPFDQKFYLILNIAVGGNWGGKYGVDDSIFPQKMEIDYVRVYQ